MKNNGRKIFIAAIAFALANVSAVVLAGASVLGR